MRAQERISCNLDFVINDSVACKAFDVSEGGMYAYTSHCFNPGSVVKITLRFRNEPIEIKARVKYCHAGVGLGLMFIDLDTMLKTKIRKIIEDINRSAG